MSTYIVLFIDALRQAFGRFRNATGDRQDYLLLVESFTNSAFALMSMVKEAVENGIYPMAWGDHPLVELDLYPETHEIKLSVRMDTQRKVDPCALLASDYTFKVMSEDDDLYIKGDAFCFDKWRKIIDIVR